jgi:hypothetical protein
MSFFGGGVPERGEIIFSAIAWATFPVQAEYEVTIVDMGPDVGCRVIFRHGNMLAAYPATRNHCDAHLATFLSLTQHLQAAPDDQGDYSEV